MPHDVHRSVADAILGQIPTADPAAWIPPWHGASGLPTNALTGRAYRGVNILALWAAAHARGYGAGGWATYKQWTTLGAQVRKGERGTTILYYRDLRARADLDDEQPDEPRFVARASFVFHAGQVVDAPTVDPLTTKIDLMPAFEAFVAATGAVIDEGENACYLPTRDEIRMPARARFTSAEGYAATLTHELVHWTGHASRLARDLTGRFGSNTYAAEELVAELGSAFVLAGLGIAVTPHSNHARYLASWLPLLQSDRCAILTAAAHASRAADYLAGFTPTSQPASAEAA